MRLILFLLLLVNYANAGTKSTMLELYQTRQYEDACSLGMRHFGNNRKDEEYVALYAFSCLKADYIDRLALPVSILKLSQEGRANAAYLSVILMQKKLLYHAIIDGYDISGLKLPTTEYVLSKVFNHYVNDDHSTKRDVYVYRDDNDPRLTYKLYVERKNRIDKMVIEEYYDTIMTQRHIYW